MGNRTLTITDDDLGATASVRIEQEHGQPVIRSLAFEAMPGSGLTSAVLALMTDLGLSLPEQQPRVRPAPRKAPAAKKAPAKKAPARRPAAAAEAPAPRPAAAGLPLPEALRSRPPAPALPAAPQFTEPAVAGPQFTEPEPAEAAPAPRQRRSGPPPSTSALTASFRNHGGDLRKMAEEFGCSTSTVNNWLRRARENGATITTLAGAAS